MTSKAAAWYMKWRIFRRGARLRSPRAWRCGFFPSRGFLPHDFCRDRPGGIYRTSRTKCRCRKRNRYGGKRSATPSSCIEGENFQKTFERGEFPHTTKYTSIYTVLIRGSLYMKNSTLVSVSSKFKLRSSKV